MFMRELRQEAAQQGRSGTTSGREIHSRQLHSCWEEDSAARGGWGEQFLLYGELRGTGIP